MSGSTQISSRVPHVMDAGDLVPLIAAYATELEALSHTRLTVANYTDPARHFAAWLRQADITLIAVIEMSLKSWLVAGIVPGVERQPLKKLGIDEGALLTLLHRWREPSVMTYSSGEYRS